MYVVLHMWEFTGVDKRGRNKVTWTSNAIGSSEVLYSQCGILYCANKGWGHTVLIREKKLEIHMRTCPHDHGQIITWHTVSFEHWHNMNSHPCRWLRRHSASLHSPLTETNQLRRRGNFKDIISIVLRIRHSLRNLILIMPRLLESCRYVSGLNSH